jgi:hypothetical protein
MAVSLAVTDICHTFYFINFIILKSMRKQPFRTRPVKNALSVTLGRLNSKIYSEIIFLRDKQVYEI